MLSIDQLVRIADKLNKAGMREEAEAVTFVLKRLAQIEPNSIPAQAHAEIMAPQEDEEPNPEYLKALHQFGKDFAINYGTYD